MNPQTRRHDLFWNLTKVLFSLLLAVLSIAPVSAQTWLNSPGSVDWNTASNWTPAVVPNAQSDAATFATSGTTNVTLGANTQVDSIRFNAGASSYNLDTNGSSLSIYGLGLSNASGAAQTLTTSSGGLIFFNSSTADNVALHNNGYTYFFGTSTASYSTITNNVTATGGVYFFDNSTADHATLTNGSLLEFAGSATAASATITNNQDMYFYNSSLAGSAAVTNHKNLYFENSSSADYSKITNDSFLQFAYTSTAGHSTLTNASGGVMSFVASSTAEASTILNSGTINFDNTTTAGGATITNNLIGVINFLGTSTAGNSNVNNLGNVFFYNSSTSGSATITNGLGLLFNNDSTAGTAAITNNFFQVFNNNSTAGNSTITNNHFVNFYDTSTAGSATITNNDTVNFNMASTAGTAVITNNDLITFVASSTAGNSTLTNNNGGSVSFGATSSASNSTLTNNNGATVIFGDTSSAGGATITNQNGGILSFAVTSTAGNSSITNNGTVGFSDYSTASNATLTNNNILAFYAYSSAGNSTIINNSSLSFQNNATAGSAAITTTNGGILFFIANSTAGTVQYTINSGGSFDLSLHTGGLSVASLEGGGGIYLGANNLAVGTNGASTTLSGVIHDGGSGGGTGGSLTKLGTGTLTLSNTNTYSGGTTVGAGILAVGDSDALGTGSVVVNGGILAAANGPLDINVGGNYTQAAGGTVRLGLGGTGAGQWDALNITGNATLAGSLDLTSYNSYLPALGDTFLILDAGGVVSGRFSQWTNPGGIRWYPIYQTDQVYLEAIQPSFAVLGLTDNQKAVGAHLDRVFEDAALENLVLDLGIQSAVALRADYDVIAPEELTPLYQIGFAAAENQALIVGRRLSDLAGGKNTNSPAPRASTGRGDEPLFADNLLPPLPVMDASPARMPAPESKWGVFVEGIGNRGTIQGDVNGAGYEFTTGGFAAGFDYRFSRDLVGGLLLGYNLSSTTSAGGGKVEDNAAQVGLYGGWNQEGFHLRGLVSGGLNQYKTQRLGYGGTATGSTQGLQFSGQLDCGYDWTFGSFRVGPFASGQYTSVQVNAFQELGSLAPLIFPSQGESAIRSEVGFESAFRWALGGMTLSPSIRASWEHRYQGNQDSLLAGLDSADTFTVQGPATGTDAAVVEAAVSAQFSKAFSATVQYRGKLGLQNYDSQSLSAGLHFGF